MLFKVKNEMLTEGYSSIEFLFVKIMFGTIIYDEIISTLLVHLVLLIHLFIKNFRSSESHAGSESEFLGPVEDSALLRFVSVNFI